MAGSAAGEFQVETQPASTLAGGQSTDLVVAFRPQAAGVRNAVLRVWTGDSLEGVFEIPVAGVGISPTMSVTGNGVVIPSGRTNATRSDYTDLGVSALAGAAVSRSFSIRNLSDSVPLRLSGAPAVVVEGPNADEFSVTQPATVDLAAQSTPAATTFKITFTPKGLGLRRATVRIQSNDAARNPYVFPIQGIGVLVNAPPASQLDHARVANGGSLNIPIAKLLANDADPEAVPLEFVDVVNPTRAGGTVSVSGTSIFYTAPAGFSGEDDFVYHLTDGALLVEGHADVTVDAPAPGTNLLGATVQSGVLQLSFAGIPGVPYRIQRCSSLVTPVAWVTVGTVVAGRNGAIDFNDTNPPSPAFYRTIAP
jgi:hypothetical protein